MKIFYSLLSITITFLLLAGMFNFNNNFLLDQKIAWMHINSTLAVNVSAAKTQLLEENAELKNLKAQHEKIKVGLAQEELRSEFFKKN
jgi:hypothetical protein